MLTAANTVSARLTVWLTARLLWTNVTALCIHKPDGWILEDLVGWQTTGTVPDFCGESIDSSLFWASAFEREGNDDMAVDEQLRAIVKDLKELVQAQGMEIEALLTLVEPQASEEIAALKTLLDSFDATALTTHEDNPDAHHA